MIIFNCSEPGDKFATYYTYDTNQVTVSLLDEIETKLNEIGIEIVQFIQQGGSYPSILVRKREVILQPFQWPESFHIG